MSNRQWVKKLSDGAGIVKFAGAVSDTDLWVELARL
jgi:hypothetical protein